VGKKNIEQKFQKKQGRGILMQKDKKKIIRKIKEAMSASAVAKGSRVSVGCALEMK
jgi:hypothetical protein